jgi:hypothetical protein
MSNAIVTIYVQLIDGASLPAANAVDQLKSTLRSAIKTRTGAGTVKISEVTVSVDDGVQHIHRNDTGFS